MNESTDIKIDIFLVVHLFIPQLRRKNKSFYCPYTVLKHYRIIFKKRINDNFDFVLLIKRKKEKQRDDKPFPSKAWKKKELFLWFHKNNKTKQGNFWWVPRKTWFLLFFPIMAPTRLARVTIYTYLLIRSGKMKKNPK